MLSALLSLLLINKSLRDHFSKSINAIKSQRESISLPTPVTRLGVSTCFSRNNNLTLNVLHINRSLCTSFLEWFFADAIALNSFHPPLQFFILRVNIDRL